MTYEDYPKSANDLIGNTISYMGKQRNVVAVTRVSGKILIVCDDEQLNVFIDPSRLKEELKNMIVIGSVPAVQNGQALAKHNESEQRQINDLKAIMMDNIQKVQRDKDYIPQAQIVTNSVNTLLNMAKLNIRLSKHRIEHE